MSAEVPVDDLPDNLVPASDLPSPGGRYVVEPNDLQRRAGIRKNRFKDENLAGNVGRGFLTMGEDAGREATLLATNLGASPSVANAAGFAADAGSAFLPVGGAGGPAKAAAPALEGPAKWFMGQALNAKSRALANGDAAKAIDTMLENGINATAGGAAKLRMLIADLKRQVVPIISQSAATVDRGYAYKELATLLDDVATKGSGYAKDQRAVRKAWEDFKNHPLLDQFAEVDNMIPIQMADKVKRATQEAADKAYGSLTKPTAADDAQMAIARGLRKGMEAAEPAIAQPNAKMHEYLNALEQIEPRAASFAKNQIAGLSPAGQSPEAMLLMLADRNPWLKSYIARALHAGREQVPAAAARGVTATALGLSRDNE